MNPVSFNMTKAKKVHLSPTLLKKGPKKQKSFNVQLMTNVVITFMEW